MIHFCVEGILLFNTTSEDKYLQSSRMVELYNGPEILMWINAVTVARTYSFWQYCELMIKFFPMIYSFEQKSIIFENIFIQFHWQKIFFLYLPLIFDPDLKNY